MSVAETSPALDLPGPPDRHPAHAGIPALATGLEEKEW